MTHLHCISYARGHRIKRVGVHGCCHSPFLVNGWWTRYIGRCPIELHGLHDYKSTLCTVLLVRAQSRDKVLKSHAVSEIVKCFCFKAVLEIVQCFYFKAVLKIVQFFCFKVVSEIVECFCFKAVLEIVQCF